MERWDRQPKTLTRTAHCAGPEGKATTIPIVMAFDDDPIGSGFVTSLARPGGKITGLSTLAPDISGKQLELLKEIVPKLSRVAVFGTSTHRGTAQTLPELEPSAKAFGLTLQYLEISASDSIESSFREAHDSRDDAALVLVSPVVLSRRTQIAKLAAKSRLPAVYPWAEFVEDGGLMTYGPTIPDLYRRPPVTSTRS
ncbi:MAG TPA: ABC transporter substrate-binding protein [Candidatus Binatia bacterium]